jgi:hypothetical protein
MLKRNHTTLLTVVIATCIAPALSAGMASQELPVRIIPNVPKSAEAYYAPDSLHVIAQTQDPAARRARGWSSRNRSGGISPPPRR